MSACADAFSPVPAAPAPQNETQSALAKIVTAGFKAVRLIYYFTAGVQEVGWPVVLPACAALSPTPPFPKPLVGPPSAGASRRWASLALFKPPWVCALPSEADTGACHYGERQTLKS